VLIAGFVSGVISEVSSHYSSIFEEMPHPPIKYGNSLSHVKSKDVYKYKGYLNLSKQYTGRLKFLGRPTVKGILLASIPSALGFLACEILVIINIDS